MRWVEVFLDLAERLFRWWWSNKSAADKAETEQAAEIERHDRKRANAIREKVDNARLGGGLGPKEGDNRGYRVD